MKHRVVAVKVREPSLKVLITFFTFRGGVRPDGRDGLYNFPPQSATKKIKLAKLSLSSGEC